MNVENLNQLEERIEKPAYLLFLVTVLLFLIIGFVNLIDHDSAETAVFGRYSAPYFGLLAVYALGMLAWSLLLRRPNDDSWLRSVLDLVQERPLIGMGIFAMFAGVLWTMFNINYWLNFPALQVTALAIMLLSAGLILFYRWDDAKRPLLWRKVIVYLLAALLIVEVAVQLLALSGILPSVTHVTDAFAPYDRIYHTAEGHNNGVANAYGWNYPEVGLYSDSHRVLLFGDSFIQALQVAPEENLGVLLQRLIENDLRDGEIIEVLALGNPDHGPGLYLNPPMIDFAVAEFEPDEVIAFFDLGSDFQTINAPDERLLYFVIDEAGEVTLHPASSELLHTYQHEVLWGYEGFQPNRFIRSHYLTPQLVTSLFNTPVASADNTIAGPQDDVALPNSFVFYPQSNDEAMALASGMIKDAHQHLAAQDIPFRLVTIPVFAESFYAQATWNTRFGDADLLLPERELRRLAAQQGIPFLGLGEYLAAAQATPNEVQTLYFKNGRGHFTPAGHEFVATAVYRCFFAQTATPDAGCDRGGE